MSRRDTVLLAVAGLALAGAATIWVFSSREAKSRDSDFPAGIRWVCLRPDCATGFTCTLAELDAFDRQHPGANMRCPKCGSGDTARARECPRCRRFFPQLAPGADPRCPHCGQTLPRLTGG